MSLLKSRPWSPLILVLFASSPPKRHFREKDADCVDQRLVWGPVSLCGPYWTRLPLPSPPGGRCPSQERDF